MELATTITTIPAIRMRRRAERRVGVNELLRDVAADWMAHLGQPDMQTTFIGRLRQLIPAQTVRLNELSGAPSIRVGQPVRAHDYVAYAVPLADSTRRVVLEASFPAEQGLDEWSCQLLEAAASLATLLFETERLTRLHQPASAPAESLHRSIPVRSHRHPDRRSSQS